MKLHIFNPEHDLALAANQSNYTAPHAGRQLHKDLAFIPALWADEHDFVLVDDIDDAYDKVRHLGAIYNKVEFITPLQLSEVFKNTMLIDSIHPWGWDLALVSQLKRLGCPEIKLPTADLLAQLREVSGRRWAAEHLQQDVEFVTDEESLRCAIERRGKAVVKAPWSSSGRGVKYVASPSALSESNDGKLVAPNLEDTIRWAVKVMKQQGGVTVEPFYNKVKDFGMEFEMKDGKVNYRGLSLFETIKGAYTGNLLATEKEKETVLRNHVNIEHLRNMREVMVEKIEPVLKNLYSGPFGIDMMIYADEEGELLVNPCVELNLRRTMGHVALDLGLSEKSSLHLMRVEYDGNRYHLRVMPGKPSEDAPMH